MAVASGVADVLCCATAPSTNARVTDSEKACSDRRHGADARRGATTGGTSRQGLLTPASWVAMFARRYMHVVRRDQRGLRPRRGRCPAPCGHQSQGLVLRQPITLEEHQSVTVDRRAAAPAGLLPGDRRRAGVRHRQRRAGARSPITPAVIRAAAQGAAYGPAHDDELLPRRQRPGSRRWGSWPAAVGRYRTRPERHPDRRPLRPLHPLRAAPARGVRLLRRR